MAEPEQDGEHHYSECTTCGYAFGWERAETVAVSGDGSCAVGIPTDIRRAASAAMESALGTQRSPLLQIGHPRVSAP